MRLAELPPGTRAVVIAEVDGPGDEIKFDTAADVSVTFAHREGVVAGASDVLARTLKTTRLPAGDYYAWVACESLIAKALRVQLLAEHGANKKWMRAAGYWRRGAVALWLDEDRITIESANESRGDRPWVPHPRPARERQPVKISDPPTTRSD